jgi:hypothetical protein
MKAKLVLSVLLAAMALAGMPGASSAGWCSALTVGCRPVYIPEGPSAEAPTREASEESRDSVFKLTCHRCHRRSYCCYPSYSYYSAYSSYPCCRYYPSYSYYPSYGYSTGYSYYPSVTYCGW